jgi:hypothetical protein
MMHTLRWSVARVAILTGTLRCCRRADAAAVSVMASGSQMRTMSAISHRIARSLSVSAPTSSATRRMGAASVSICRPLGDHAGAFRLQGGESLCLNRELVGKVVALGLPPFVARGMEL